MSEKFIYYIKDLSKTYPGGKTVLKNIYLSFYPGAKIGVLGHNGSGKSTLLKIMAGRDTEFNGEAWAAKGTRIGYLEQEPHLDENKNVFENVMDGLREKKKLLDQFNALSMQLCEVMDDDEMNRLLEEQGNLQERIDAMNAWNLDNDIEIAMEALRCPPADSDVRMLSGGERRRVALARLLLEKPDMLLLDEPTNHLDAESVAWLQRFLKEYEGTVVMVTHDRYFLDHVTGWILELDRGEGIPYEGNYSSWLDQKQKRLKQEEKEESSRQKQIAEELEWVKQSPKARQAKSKARIKAFDDLVNRSKEKRNGTAQIIIPVADRLGDVVIKADRVGKSFGEKYLIDNLSFTLPPGGIIGVIGPNGAGKSTLFRMITKQETPDVGTFTIGDTVHLGYVDQSRDSLNDKNSVWQEISGGDEEIILGGQTVKSRAYCSSFNFKGADQQKTIGMLSGGERNRVHMAKMLKQGANVILLDEPTNDLDVETLRALEDALLDFAGCAVIISHDRWFLDRIATHILAFEGDSHVEWFEGNYQEYEEDRKRRLGDSALNPTRIKYKPISRAA
ncbi:MAG: energy-dependent translational throttle protein EttA [Alphaproteobacteria bacterium]|nr:MAG: energy-dependent translational throttle protein EttA [Alphaproteobacteria bacterium]